MGVQNRCASAWRNCSASQYPVVFLASHPLFVRSLGWFWACVLLATLSACATTPIEPVPEPVVERTSNEVLISTVQDRGLVADEVDRGVRIFLPKMTFEYNSVELSGEAERKVSYIADILESDLADQRQIVVAGHADSLGAAENNLKVSRLRAEKVVVMLESLGVDGQRISPEWYGDDDPIIPNTLVDGSDNPEGRALNRRVEVIILNP